MLRGQAGLGRPSRGDARLSHNALHAVALAFSISLSCSLSIPSRPRGAIFETEAGHWLLQSSTMTVYSTSKGSHYLMSQTLSQAIQYLGENATMNLFSVKNVNLGSSQTVFNPDGRPIADTVHLSMRSSSIGSNSVDCKWPLVLVFHFIRDYTAQLYHSSLKPLTLHQFSLQYSFFTIHTTGHSPLTCS